MSKKKKPQIEYRYYAPPPDSPVLSLLGDNWVRNYGDSKPIDRLHFHNHLEIGYCYWGRGILNLNNTDFEFGEKTFSLIPRNFPHATSNVGYGLSSWEYLYIDADKFLKEFYLINPILAEDMISRVNRKAHFCHAEDYPEIVVLIQQIFEIMRNKKDLYQEAVKGIILALLIQIARLNKSDKDTNNFPDIINTVISPALEHISHHAAEQIKVNYLAEICHVSETHFRRIFSDCMGKTPVEYINWVRIKTACDLLKQTDDSINSIAVKISFSTVSTFNRNFRNLIGISPQEYRKAPEYYEQKLLNYNISTHQGWL